MQKNKKVILAVSFGTSYHDTSRKNIDAIEEEIRSAYPDYEVRRAYTSKMIIDILKKRDNIQINTVAEALEELKSEGIAELIVQPTHIINGIENDNMIEALSKYKEDFPVIRLGSPLITSHEDYVQIVDFIKDNFIPDNSSNCLIFMGHGSSHHANSAYAALDYYCKNNNLENVYIATVEGYPSLDEIMSSLEDRKPEKVLLTPFMIVAGDHAINDMSSDEEDSWNQILIRAGYNTECIIKGLGEYEMIRKMFIRHIEESKVL